MRARAVNLPAEALREGLIEDEEEVARVAVRNLVTEVVSFFILALAAAEEAGDDDLGVPSESAALTDEASDGSSMAGVAQ